MVDDTAEADVIVQRVVEGSLSCPTPPGYRPEFSLTPSSGPVGILVTARGSGFLRNAQAAILVAEIAYDSASGFTDVDGSFIIDGSVPDSAMPQTYTIVACSGTVHTRLVCADARFTVEPLPSADARPSR